MPSPNVITHTCQDHRFVDPEELRQLNVYKITMTRKNSNIMDYACTRAKEFLIPTSKWNELHLIAFRCLLLENLPISRIIPQNDMPNDDDATMRLVNLHLLATEEEVRSGRALEAMGPAFSFYQQLQVVLRRPATPPSPIPISRSLKPGTSTTIFPTILESLSESDSSYQPSPEDHRINPAEIPPLVNVGLDTSPSRRPSSESTRSGQSTASDSSMGEDKLEVAANQAVVTFLRLLCGFEQISHPNEKSRLTFRFSATTNHCSRIQFRTVTTKVDAAR